MKERWGTSSVIINVLVAPLPVLVMVTYAPMQLGAVNHSAQRNNDSKLMIHHKEVMVVMNFMGTRTLNQPVEAQAWAERIVARCMKDIVVYDAEKPGHLVVIHQTISNPKAKASR